MENDTIKQKTKDNFISVLESDQAYGSISKACAVCVLSRQTIYDWKRIDEAFSQAVQNAVATGKALLADIAEEALVRRVKADDTTAIIFTLKSLRRDYYGEKALQAEVNETTNNGQATPLGTPRTPLEAKLMMSLLIKHYRYCLNETDVMSPELRIMFDKLEDVTG